MVFSFDTTGNFGNKLFNVFHFSNGLVLSYKLQSSVFAKVTHVHL